ncbi:MAG TPA: S9 family peptidase [Chloroflexia bacterium]|nr:S9 family peptidase [Chloroflexia bacterium]
MLKLPKKEQPALYEQFAATRLFQIWPFPAVDIAPDGSQVAYSINTSGQFNLWVQPVDGIGLPRQLTLFSDETVRNLAWSPDSQNLAVVADNDGNELYQLYTIPAKGGWPERLSRSESSQYSVGGWSPSGEYLAFTTNDRDPADTDVVIRHMVTGVEQRLTGNGRFTFAGWTPDSQGVLVRQNISNTNSNLYLAIPGQEPKLLTPHEADANYIPAGWSADGKSFYLITDEGREFKGLARYSLDEGNWQYLLTPEWDIEAAVVSANGQRLAWVLNEDGYSVLHVTDFSSNAELKLPALPRGVIMKPCFSADGRRLAFFFTSPTLPVEVFLLDLEKGETRQLTDNFLGGLDHSSMVEPEIVRFTSFDGRQIPAYLYRPLNANGKAPVLVSIHGGPEMQERPEYSFAYPGMYQYLLSRGIGVLATNIRGSSGYGKSYQQLIHRDWGGGELKDIEAGVKYLSQLDWVDPSRIGVFGISFGGFATLSSVSRLPELWKVAAEWYGPSNLISFVQSVPPSWRSMTDAWVGNPERDREMLLERSPLTHVERIKAPLLIIQGSQDWRVVKAESDQIVESLVKREHPVRYEVFEDEGHGFLRRENLLKALKMTVDWLENGLLGD